MPLKRFFLQNAYIFCMTTVTLDNLFDFVNIKKNHFIRTSPKRLRSFDNKENIVQSMQNK